MTHILVPGLINIETTLRVDAFPIEYSPDRYPFFGIHSSVSGIGFNLAKALTILGHETRLVSIIGQDVAALQVLAALSRERIPDDFIIQAAASTAQSVILYDGENRRQINADLKDIPKQVYPPDVFRRASEGTTLQILSNENFSRPFLQHSRQAGKTIVTDVHAIASIDDPHNADFMDSADILFMSHERLSTPPEDWARAVMQRYSPEIVVIGMGGAGALLAVRSDQSIKRIPAVTTRPHVNTIGAGDALLAGFIHALIETGDPYLAVHRAVVFASYKIGAVSAAEGFLDSEALDRWYTVLSSYPGDRA